MWPWEDYAKENSVICLVYFNYSFVYILFGGCVASVCITQACHNLECIYYFSQHPCNIKKYYCYYLFSSLVVQLWGTQPADYRDTPTSEDENMLRWELRTAHLWWHNAMPELLSHVSQEHLWMQMKHHTILVLPEESLWDRPCALHSPCCVQHHGEALL